MGEGTPDRSRIAVVVVVLVALATVPGVAAAETRAGGTVIVEQGETVDGLTAFAGNVIVRGTVEGDLTAFAGNVVLAETGRVTGELYAMSGNLRVAGTVVGDVTGFGGNVLLTAGGEVGGDLDAAAGTVQINGAVAGGVRAGAGTVAVGPQAVVDGDLEYNGELELAEGAVVDGQVVRNQNLGFGENAPFNFGVPNWLATLWGLVLNLVLGIVLLTFFPVFTRTVVERAVGSPLRSGGIGFLTLVVVPVVLALFAITIVGIPLTIFGAIIFAFAAWVATVYGSYAVGTYLLDLADADSRWGALVAGLVILAFVGFIPVLGGLYTFLVFLLGLGALVRATWRRYRRQPRVTEPAPGREPEEEPGAPAP